MAKKGRKYNSEFKKLDEKLDEKKKDIFLYKHDTKRDFTHFSNSVSHILGYSPERCKKIFKTLFTNSPLNDIAYDHTKKSIKGIDQKPYRAELTDKNGNIHIFEVTETPVFDKSKNVKYIEGQAQDITNRVNEESRNQQETLVKVFHNFIGDSLNNRLAISDMNLSVYLSGIEKSKETEELTLAQQILRKMSHGIRIFGQYSNLKGTPNKKIDLNEILLSKINAKYLTNYENEMFNLENTNITYLQNGSKNAIRLQEVPKIYGSQYTIDQAINEILINAEESYKKTDKNKKIELSIKDHEHSIILKIQDYGSGISPNELAFIQLPFYKTAGTKNSTRFGLGIYLAKQAIEYQGGSLSIESEVKKGTSVYLAFKK